MDEIENSIIDIIDLKEPDLNEEDRLLWISEMCDLMIRFINKGVDITPDQAYHIKKQKENL